MSDRYLFKAKRSSDETWIFGCGVLERKHGTVLVWADRERRIFETYVDPSTLCQCTGLKDKNGNLIWENDIVRCIDQINDSKFYAVVKFGNPNGFYSWGYQLKHIKGDKPNLNILLWVDMEETGATIEVIGNIFDNPELLEVE